MQYYTTVGQEAIDHVREKLKDNKRVLEVMDFLVEENVRYQKIRKRNRYITILVQRIINNCYIKQRPLHLH